MRNFRLALLGIFALLLLMGFAGCDEEATTPPVGVQSVEKTATEGLKDTYTITLTDGSTTTFTIHNGENGHTPVIEIGENGNWFVDGVDTEVKAQPEKGLSAYELYLK